jgi:hypothetical protein
MSQPVLPSAKPTSTGATGLEPATSGVTVLSVCAEFDIDVRALPETIAINGAI